MCLDSKCLTLILSHKKIIIIWTRLDFVVGLFRWYTAEKCPENTHHPFKPTVNKHGVEHNLTVKSLALPVRSGQ